jgi:hypothetical protein
LIALSIPLEGETPKGATMISSWEGRLRLGADLVLTGKEGPSPSRSGQGREIEPR